MRTCLSCRGLAPETATSCPQCGAAMPTARFRLHPSTSEEIVPPVPAPTPARPRPDSPSPYSAPSAEEPPQPYAPFAPAPTKAATPATAEPSMITRATARLVATTPRERALLAAGAVAVVIMLIAAGFWYGTSETARYPDRYLLEEQEMPPGWRPVALPAEARNELGITENPGKLSRSGLENLESDTGIIAEEGWAQTLGRTGLFDAVIVFALRFNNDGDADDWVREARNQCRDGGRLLQDRSVVLLVLSAGRNDADAQRVANEILGKAPRLSEAC